MVETRARIDLDSMVQTTYARARKNRLEDISDYRQAHSGDLSLRDVLFSLGIPHGTPGARNSLLDIAERENIKHKWLADKMPDEKFEKIAQELAEKILLDPKTIADYMRENPKETYTIGDFIRASKKSVGVGGNGYFRRKLAEIGDRYGVNTKERGIPVNREQFVLICAHIPLNPENPSTKAQPELPEGHKLEGVALTPNEIRVVSGIERNPEGLGNSELLKLLGGSSEDGLRVLQTIREVNKKMPGYIKTTRNRRGISATTVTNEELLAQDSQEKTEEQPDNPVTPMGRDEFTSRLKSVANLIEERQRKRAAAERRSDENNAKVKTDFNNY